MKNAVMITKDNRSYNYLLSRFPVLREFLGDKGDWKVELDFDRDGKLVAKMTRSEFQETATIITDGTTFSVFIKFPGTAGQYDRTLAAENFWAAWVLANDHAQWWQVKLALL